ncbi:MAG: hypothetical protein QOJ40_2597, partial [Verrucomicrobiota bacterium]
MKIALLIRRYITTGGAERYAVEVARRLARAHEVHVFSQEWDHQPQGMVLHRVSRPFRKPNFVNQWWYSWRACRMTRGFDVVYTHERVTRFDVMNIHCAPFVAGLWGAERGGKSAWRTWLKVLTGPGIWAYWILEKLHNKPARGRFWVADSEMVKLEVQRYYPIPDDRFLIAHSGVDQPASDPAATRAQLRGKLGLTQTDVVALFVGSEFERKGLGPLIEAMGILGKRAPKLIIVGGDDRTPYESRARELALDGQITWTGRVSNVKDYYAASDIFVLPTLSDPSPLSPLEAMAHGCATIISGKRYTGAAELTKNGEAILLEDPRNAAGIATAIERLLDPAIRKEYANRGRELARQLSWD